VAVIDGVEETSSQVVVTVEPSAPPIWMYIAILTIIIVIAAITARLYTAKKRYSILKLPK